MIEFKNITLKFKNTVIFDNLNLKIKKREKTVITGMSGKGKTTILNMIIGFTIPINGKIIVNNKEVNSKNISEIRKLISFVPQNVNIPFKKTEEMLYAVFKYSEKVPPVKKINEMLLKFNLDRNILKKDTGLLSGGEKQRILLISSILSEKKILLWDEPTSALDKENKKILIDIFKNLNTTILSVSHDKEFINSAQKTIDI